MANRGIAEVLHFTTSRGVLGVLHTGALKARQRLATDKQLQYILKVNAASREKDSDWLDYVNLSIGRINSWFFDISSGKWHVADDLFWAVLAFDVEILSHDDVYFTTTNNIYTGVKRARGAKGIEGMFAPKIVRWTGNVVVRDAGQRDNEPTCLQAEVLYPKQVLLKYLRTIYVRKDDEEDELSAQLAITRNQRINIVTEPEIFA